MTSTEGAQEERLFRGRQDQKNNQLNIASRYGEKYPNFKKSCLCYNIKSITLTNSVEGRCV